ncbi:hypothetical protein FIBSPDRAFT_1055863 [Athelia psychrophila]|uniref:NAD(P)-binding protein n=1 Tax=Athelia psychrophila TaxID=1759441 RepID=A0A167T1C3_9AGAM|nr:hypothetical protein FIBSPDRAFT_1055863 [Fibularhizoctonia sp. CBS 109695]
MPQGVISGLLDRLHMVDPPIVNMEPLAFLEHQLFTYLPIPTESYVGKTVIVTGSNIGLGKEAAKRYARLGAETVIVAVHSVEKGEAVKSEIIRQTRCSMQGQRCASLAARSQQFRERPARTRASRIATPNFGLAEGYESAITDNVISPSLLCLCLQKLKDAAQKHNVRPTATIVPSAMHMFCSDFPKADAADGKMLDALSDPHRANMATRSPHPSVLKYSASAPSRSCIRRTNTP